MSDPNESFVRWQKITIDQVTFILNVILGLSSGILAFSVILLKDDKFILTCWAKCFFVFGCGFIILSIMIALSCSLIRLSNFRKTAKTARLREKGGSEIEIEKLREETDKLGDRSWFLFYSQVMLFGAGVLFLVISISIVFRDKLF